MVFNIGGGIEFSLSLLELFEMLECILNIKMKYNQLPERESDQLIFVADGSKINSFIGWKPKITIENGILKTLNWLDSK